MTQLRLYAPALVLTCWAILWSAGFRSVEIVTLGLLVTAAATWIAERTRWQIRTKLRKDLRRRRGT